MYIAFVFLSCFLFGGYDLIAQEYIELEGIIIDIETNQPLQYANIDLTDNRLGTISNKNGEFKLKLPTKLINKKIVFSYLGSLLST